MKKYIHFLVNKIMLERIELFGNKLDRKPEQPKIRVIIALVFLNKKYIHCELKYVTFESLRKN